MCGDSSGVTFSLLVAERNLRNERDAIEQLKGLIFDKYTVQARLRPGLLVVLPALITIALWLPSVWTFLGGISALVSACGLTLLLAEIARFRGRQIERAMIAKNGGKFTTIFLRHEDSTISSASKLIYHDVLRKQANRSIPTEEEERKDRSAADDRYRGAVEWLLEATRDQKRFPLVMAENISYGFRRNLLGLKLAAIFSLIFCLCMDAWFTWQSLGKDANKFRAGVATGTGLFILLLIWTFVVNMDFVEDAGRSYALRLLAQCDVLRAKESPARSRTKPKGDSNV